MNAQQHCPLWTREGKGEEGASTIRKGTQENTQTSGNGPSVQSAMTASLFVMDLEGHQQPKILQVRVMLVCASRLSHWFHSMQTALSNSPRHLYSLPLSRLRSYGPLGPGGLMVT